MWDTVVNRASVGLFDRLKPKSPLQKAATQVREPFAQGDYRRGAMDTLFELGTDESYQAVLKRFTINANGTIADESEKKDLIDMLVRVGTDVLPAIKTFIRTEKIGVSFAIRAVCRILDKPEAIAFLKETLQAYEPEDHRSVAAKATLIITLGEMVDASEVEVFVPYLDDHDDDVQTKAIAAIEHLAVESTCDALVNVCCSKMHSARVRRTAAASLVELGWSVKDRYGDFDAELKDEYLLSKKGHLNKKTAPDEE